MEHYLGECEHTFNILETERNNTPYKGKHYENVQYDIEIASTVIREKETPKSKLQLRSYRVYVIQIQTKTFNSTFIKCELELLPSFD
jgi:hypothetical protein